MNREWNVLKAIRACALVAFAFGAFSVDAHAVTLIGEYSINTSISYNGSNSYTFDYYVTNVDQSLNSGIQPVGLDRFLVYIPDAASIYNITNPPIFTNIWPGPPSYWTSSIQSVGSKRYIGWFGVEWNSVYPEGTTAHFSFTADNVGVGIANASVLTFWNANPVGDPAYFSSGAYYTDYTTELRGPVPIPEPTTFLLLGAGLTGVGFLRRSKTR